MSYLWRNAGIRTWMLTGDKLETATCIAKSSRLVARTQAIHIFKTVGTRSEAHQELNAFRRKQGRVPAVEYSLSRGNRDKTGAHCNDHFTKSELSQYRFSGTTGPILLIFLVQNPYKFTKLLWKKIVDRYSHCWDSLCRRLIKNWCPDSFSYCPQCWECDVSRACAVHSFTEAVKPVLPHTSAYFSICWKTWAYNC